MTGTDSYRNPMDRELQRRLLLEMRVVYPRPLAEPPDFTGDHRDPYVFNLSYLAEHGLCTTPVQPLEDGSYEWGHPRLTAGGLDFLADGGFGAVWAARQTGGAAAADATPPSCRVTISDWACAMQAATASWRASGRAYVESINAAIASIPELATFKSPPPLLTIDEWVDQGFRLLAAGLVEPGVPHSRPSGVPSPPPAQDR